MRAIFGLAISLGVALSFPVGGATHDDGFYDQPVWFDWNKLTLAAEIIPPEHGQLFNNNFLLNNLDPAELNPCTSSYTRAMRDVVADWKLAIQTWGSAHLKNDLQINAHILGCDAGAPFTSPEIVVATYEASGPVLGASVSGDPCLVTMSRLGTVGLSGNVTGRSFNYEDMYSVIAHEFGHCLGQGHTGDLDGGAAGDPGHPNEDVMEGSYGHPIGSAQSHKHCPSNLNVKVMEEVFDGQGGDGGDIVSIAVSQYAKLCP